MAELKRPDTVGVNIGLITNEGKVRYQMRTESGSIISGVSYKGDFELPGGGTKEKDLKKLLTPESLLMEGAWKTRDDLGVEVRASVITVNNDFPPIYWTVYEHPTTGKIDWAFEITILPAYWDEKAEVKRKIVDVNPMQLDVLGELNLIVSGKKRMYRMGQGALCIGSSDSDWGRQAAAYLAAIKPDWKKTEFLEGPKWRLGKIRKELGLE